MDTNAADRALVALVDDDPHSARLMARTLAAQGFSSIRWCPSPESVLKLSTPVNLMDPLLVIVDLKATSTATRTFIAQLRELPGGRAPLVIGMSPTLESDCHRKLIDAGADAVFERRADLDSYRREASLIASFWRRAAPLEAVGT